MFNKESLKKLNKGQYLVTTLVTSILAAATLVGCGAKADSGGAEVATEATEALVETDVGKANEVETPDDAAVEEDAEDILEREKPVIYRKKSKKVPIDSYITSNQFLMIEEVEGEPEEGYGDSLSHLYVKVKGTLYEVFLDDLPEYDLVYYPGDELPEGYTVKETRDYEVVLSDASAYGEEHADLDGEAWLVKEVDGGIYSYKEFFSGCYWDNDLDPTIPSNKAYAAYPALDIGMYGNLYLYHVNGFPMDSTLFIQYLTKEDMEKLPEDAELAENVAHQ